MKKEDYKKYIIEAIHNIDNISILKVIYRFIKGLLD